MLPVSYVEAMQINEGRDVNAVRERQVYNNIYVGPFTKDGEIIRDREVMRMLASVAQTCTLHTQDFEIREREGMRMLASVVETCTPCTQDGEISGDREAIQNINSGMIPQRPGIRPSLKRQFIDASGDKGDNSAVPQKRRTSRPYYDQDDSREMSLKRPEIRPSCDVH